jgi:hypothetical protein
MARDAAIIATWSTPIPGREAKSIEVFMEFMEFWGKKAADGRVSQPQVFFNQDGSEGVFIVTGKSDALVEIAESEDFEKLTAKGQMIVQDLKSHVYYGGTDDEITRGTRIFAEAGNELGYM